MRPTRVITVGLIAVIAGTSQAASQPVDRNAPPQGVVCPPDVKGEGPRIGGDNRDLSDRLADSKGVICPPAGVDPEIQIAPPGGGELKVIPPPGTPGGNPNVQPK